jgi:hypothetical protein
MRLGTWMMIIAAIALVLALFIRLTVLDGWFWYGFFLTSTVVAVFMGLVLAQAWVLTRLLQLYEDYGRRSSALHAGLLENMLTVLLYVLVPAVVAAVAGIGTWLFVTRILGRLLGRTS